MFYSYKYYINPGIWLDIKFIIITICIYYNESYRNAFFKVIALSVCFGEIVTIDTNKVYSCHQICAYVT